MATSDLAFDGELLNAKWLETLFKAMTPICAQVTLKFSGGQMEFLQLNDATSVMAATNICTKAWSQYMLAPDLAACEVRVDLNSLMRALRVLHATTTDTVQIYIPRLRDCIHFRIIRGGRIAHFELKTLCLPAAQTFPDVDDFTSDAEVIVRTCDIARAIDQMQGAMCHSNHFSLNRSDFGWQLIVVSDDDDSDWQVTAEMTVLEIDHREHSAWNHVHLQSASFNVDLIATSLGANKIFKHVKVCLCIMHRMSTYVSYTDRIVNRQTSSLLLGCDRGCVCFVLCGTQIE